MSGKPKDRFSHEVAQLMSSSVFQPIVLSLSDDVKSSMMTELKTKDLSFVRVTAHKPAYEVGSSSQLKLSFGKKKTGWSFFGHGSVNYLNMPMQYTVIFTAEINDVLLMKKMIFSYFSSKHRL